TSPDIFLYDVSTGGVSLVTHTTSSSTTSAASQSDQDLLPVSMSKDGRYVVYASKSTSLVSGVTDTNSKYDIFLYDASSGDNKLASHTSSSTAASGAVYNFTDRLVISADGKWVTFVGGTATSLNVYLYQVSTDSLTLVSHTASSTTTTATGDTPTIS